MRGLDGRCALVTGAGSGIGRAIAERLAEEGARVAVSDMVLADAETTAKGIGGDAIAVELDVTNDDSIRRAVAEVTERIGPIEVLVNNAGWDRIEPFVDSAAGDVGPGPGDQPTRTDRRHPGGARLDDRAALRAHRQHRLRRRPRRVDAVKPCTRAPRPV